MVIGDVRTALKDALSTISGLRCYDVFPDSMSPPAAIVGMPTQIIFDTTLVRTNDTAVFPIRLLVGKATDAAAQRRLDVYLQGSGSSSVKEVLETADPGGDYNVLRVLSAQGMGVYDYNGVGYLGVEFTVEVVG
jgi:hypothetical protein